MYFPISIPTFVFFLSFSKMRIRGVASVIEVGAMGNQSPSREPRSPRLASWCLLTHQRHYELPCHALASHHLLPMPLYNRRRRAHDPHVQKPAYYEAAMSKFAGKARLATLANKVR